MVAGSTANLGRGGSIQRLLAGYVDGLGGKVAAWLVIILAPLFYWFNNRSITGPAFLNDESSYLATAAFLGGHPADGGSTFHAGYSLFLAPAFALFSKPIDVWHAIMAVNALLWLIALLLLYRLLPIWAPESTQAHKLLALLLAALYPVGTTMTGYAFVTSLFVPAYMCSILALVRWKPEKPVSVLPFSMAVSFLYWIHPSGLAALAASLAVVGLASLRAGRPRSLILHTVAALVLAGVYDLLIQPWLMAAMAPPGYLPGVFGPKVTTLLAGLTDPGFWARAAVMFCGHLSYLIVGTFGLVVLAAVECAQLLRGLARRAETAAVEPVRARIACYIMVALVTMAFLGMLMPMSYGPKRVDEWIHGRYIDHVALPLVAFGVLSIAHFTRKRRLLYALAAGVAIILLGSAMQAINQYHAGFALMTVPAFWPAYLKPEPGFVLWMAMVVLAMLAIAWGGRYLAVLAMLASFLLAAPRQTVWHARLLAWNARPSSLVELVRANFPPGSCIGIDLVGIPNQDDFRSIRYPLYGFYFFNYRYRRMTPAEWLTSCDGPYLTYDPQRFAGEARVRIAAREAISGLVMFTKSGEPSLAVPEAVRAAHDLYLASQGDSTCLVANCLSMRAPELAAVFSLAGRLVNGSIVTDGRTNFMIYGPYLPLEQGPYELVLHGQFDEVAGSRLLIMSSDATYVESSLSALGVPSAGELVVPFDVPAKVRDIQVALWVSAGDSLSVSGYEILPAAGR